MLKIQCFSDVATRYSNYVNGVLIDSRRRLWKIWVFYSWKVLRAIPCIVAPEVSEFQDRRPFSLATLSSLFAHAIICTPNHLPNLT